MFLIYFLTGTIQFIITLILTVYLFQSIQRDILLNNLIKTITEGIKKEKDNK